MIVEAIEVLQKHFGYSQFRKGQANVIESILGHKDIFTIMPTGAGKSLCFQVPAMLFSGVTLVITPLISLMKDQVDALEHMGISATYINSSLPQKEVNKRMERAAQGAYKLLYVAPERLQIEAFSQLVQAQQISLVAVDEAHCVSQWGHDFRPSYRKIAKFIKSLTHRPIVAAFTATATDTVKQDIVHLLALHSPKIYVTGFDRENLFFDVVKNPDKDGFVLDYVSQYQEQGGIIYAATRREVDKMYQLLTKRGYSCERYHAGMTSKQRKTSQDRFVNDEVRLMVATNAFGMGIDKSNIRYVLHYNMPKNIESYYQEAGRAGRDGEPGECLLLFGAQDVVIQKFMIEQSVYSPRRRENELTKLQEMVDYCHTPRCLRGYILAYFGEQEVVEACGNCGNCTEDKELVDITIEAQKIISCVIHMKQKFGSTLVAQVLVGSDNARVRKTGFKGLSTYGIMRDFDQQGVRELINVLVADGYLKMTTGKYPLLKVTEKALPVLKGQASVSYKVQKAKRRAPMDNQLFEQLRKLRSAIAKEEEVPPYIIFSDRTLRAMSQNRPVDKEQMLKIPGVGQAKYGKYGALFLDVIVNGGNEIA